METNDIKALKDKVKEFKALARKIGFPGGGDVSDYTKPYKGAWVTDAKGKQKYDNAALNWEGVRLSMRWHKSRGHAGRNTISRVVEKALKAGFVAKNTNFNNTPDGSHMGRGTYYTKHVRGKLVATLYTSSSYGVTSYENSFSIHLDGPPVKVEGE
jgi:hypothetical protein